MSTNAASTPSAEVPDIKPMTYMGQEPSRPLATNQGNCASAVPSFVLPEVLVYNLPAFLAAALRSHQERTTSYGTRIHRPREDGHEHGHTPAARQAPRGRLRPGDGSHQTGGKGGLRRDCLARGHGRQAESAPRRVDHGALRSPDRRDRQESGLPALRRRHHYRRRQHQLPRRRSEEHTSELQSLAYLVCRLLLEKKKKHKHDIT